MELLYLLFGICIGYLVFRPEKKEKAPLSFEEFKKEEFEPMDLRNGFKVTRCEKPTFAEQFINILNYEGENQKEETYEKGT